MIKTSLAIAGALLLMTTVTDTMASDVKTAHAFTFQEIDGGNLPLSRFAGKAVLVVNTASNCGFTPQYSALQDVWSRYRDKGLVVLGVPSNDFGGQEPGSAIKIKEFCEVNFNVDFPMTGKVHIRDDTPHPFYAWALKELAEKHAACLMVGHIERFNPVVRAMEKLDASGQGVKPRFIEVHRVSPMTFRSVDVGVVMDMMIHDIDVVLSLMGGLEPSDIQASGVAV
ncbi:MAG: hypothetical protein CMF66_02515, partial [Magnetovibrio sp.]|nr:hypothetical protein [Magnetovibrio sp.]